MSGDRDKLHRELAVLRSEVKELRARLDAHVLAPPPPTVDEIIKEMQHRAMCSPGGARGR